MGLAERFGSGVKLNKIVKDKISLSPKIIEIKPKVIEIDTYKKFEDLETDTINKIRKTPHWQDYPLKNQENMISKYFDSKIKGKYSDINYTNTEKLGFIKNILTLANSK